MRVWLGRTPAQVVTALGVLLLIVGIVGVLMVLAAPGPVQQFVNEPAASA